MSGKILHSSGARNAKLIAGALLCLSLGGCVDFSPDGEQIVFGVPDDAPKPYRNDPVLANGHLVTQELRSGRRRALPQSAGRLFPFGFAPRWSPDGRKIVFVKPGYPPKTRQLTSQVLLFDVATRKTRFVGRNLFPPFVWRPDSRSFVALDREKRPDGSYNESKAQVVWCGLDGKIRRRESFAYGAFPVATFANRGALWVPGTDEVVFVASNRVMGGSGANLYKTSRGAISRITNTFDIADAALTPRGELVWARLKRQWPKPAALILEKRVSLNAPIKHLAELKAPVLEGTVAEQTQISGVTLAPDAKRLVVEVAGVVTADKDEEMDRQRNIFAAFLLEADGSQMLPLDRSAPTVVGGMEVNTPTPVWSRDAKRFVFLKTGSPSPEFWLYEVATHSQKRLSS